MTNQVGQTKTYIEVGELLKVLVEWEAPKKTSLGDLNELRQTIGPSLLHTLGDMEISTSPLFREAYLAMDQEALRMENLAVHVILSRLNEIQIAELRYHIQAAQINKKIAEIRLSM